MADNYLEKRYEEVFGKGPKVPRVPQRPSLDKLLAQTAAPFIHFDTTYRLHPLQLDSIAAAGRKVAPDGFRIEAAGEDALAVVLATASANHAAASAAVPAVSVDHTVVSVNHAAVDQAVASTSSFDHVSAAATAAPASAVHVAASAAVPASSDQASSASSSASSSVADWARAGMIAQCMLLKAGEIGLAGRVTFFAAADEASLLVAPATSQYSPTSPSASTSPSSPTSLSSPSGPGTQPAPVLALLEFGKPLSGQM